MATPRFEVASAFIAFFVDRLRLESFEEMGRACVAASADGRAHAQAPIIFDVAKQDAAAYRRAVEAFSAVMDAHEAKTAERNERRRMRRALTPVPAKEAA